jgi:hypothetical protein
LDDDSDDGGGGGGKDKEPSGEGRRTKKQHVSVNGRADPVQSSSSAAAVSQSTTNVETADQLFWDGEVRPIANKHSYPRKDGKPTFRLTEILGKACPSTRIQQRLLFIHLALTEIRHVVCDLVIICLDALVDL